MACWTNAMSRSDVNDLVAESLAFDAKTGRAYLMLMLRLRVYGSVPSDDMTLAQIAHCTKSWWMNRAWPALREIFEISEDGRLYHPDVIAARGAVPHPSEAEDSGAAARSARASAAAIAMHARRRAAVQERRDQLHVVSHDDDAQASTQAGIRHAPEHAQAANSHAQNDGISEGWAAETHARSMLGAAGASGASSLSQQEDSLGKGLKNQEESPGESVSARAGAHADSAATEHARAGVEHATEQAKPSGSRRTRQPKVESVLTLIPADWTPSAESEREATIRGFTVAELLPRFIDYYRGKGELRADWDAVFRNWCRIEAKNRLQSPEQRRQANLPMSLQGEAAGQPPAADEAPEIAADCMRDDAENPRLTAAWMRIRGVLRKEMGEAAYRTWFRPMTLLGIDDDELIIELPSSHTRDWVREKHGPRVSALWKLEYPEMRRVDFRVGQRTQAGAHG